MADIVSPEVRSRMMARIGGKNTQPEVTLRKALYACGFRYRVNVRDLPGSPDIVFPKHRAVIFIHGCFWHQHKGCRFATMPSTNSQFWHEKFLRNVSRDRENVTHLFELDWRVGIVWECAMKRMLTAEVTDKIAEFLTSDAPALEIPLTANFQSLGSYDSIKLSGTRTKGETLFE